MVDPIESLGRLLLSLGAIVGVLLAVRHWAQRGRRGSAGPGVVVLARGALSRSAVVALVEADGRRFLVGAGDQGVRLLTELAPEEPAPVEAVAPALVLDATTDGGSSSTLERPSDGRLLDRLRTMTVRTHVDRPVRVPLR